MWNSKPLFTSQQPPIRCIEQNRKAQADLSSTFPLDSYQLQLQAATDTSGSAVSARTLTSPDQCRNDITLQDDALYALFLLTGLLIFTEQDLRESKGLTAYALHSNNWHSIN